MSNDVELDAQVCAVLTEARNFLSGPEKWTRDTLFRDEKGADPRLRSDSSRVPLDDVCQACLLGAISIGISRVEGRTEVRDYRSDYMDFEHRSLFKRATHVLEDAIDHRLGHPAWVANFNDAPDTMFEDVAAVLNDAKAAACAGLHSSSKE